MHEPRLAATKRHKSVVGFLLLQSRHALFFAQSKNRVYNAPLLLMLRPPQKRLIAALLPFSFLWVFMACVSICERETLVIHPATDLSSSTDINARSNVRDCDGCPLSLPKATTPERTKPIHAAASLSSFTFVFPSTYSASPDVFRERLNKPLSDRSPSLQSLASLRI